MSKFRCLGVSLDAVVKAATMNAAAALKRPDLGSLRPGSAGDASIITVENGVFDYVDSTDATLRGKEKIVARHVVIGGHLWNGGV
jgi:dihydroorotase